MFRNPLSPNQKEMLELFQNSHDKGQCFIEMYLSIKNKQAVQALAHMLPESICSIKEEIRKKSDKEYTTLKCRLFLSYFYHTYRNYEKEKSFRNDSLFCIMFFGFIDILCLGAIFITGKYFFSSSEGQPSMKKSSFLDTLIRFGKAFGVFSIGASALCMVLFSIDLILGYRENYIQKRQATAELKVALDQIIQNEARRILN